MIRQPAVANQFYPGIEADLKRDISGRIKPAGGKQKKEKVLALVSPHAGYIYSGNIAGADYSQTELTPDVMVIGPTHRGTGY